MFNDPFTMPILVILILFGLNVFQIFRHTDTKMKLDHANKRIKVLEDEKNS